MTRDDTAAVRRHDDKLIIAVRVQTRASRNSVEGVTDGQLRIRTTAPPDAGEANQVVLKLLANFLGVPPSRISLLRGHKNRSRQFLVNGPVTIPRELIETGE